MIRPTALAGLLAVLQGLAPAHAQESRTLDRYQIDFNGLQAPVDATWLTDDRLVVLESAPPAIRIADWLTGSSPIAIDCGEPDSPRAPTEPCWSATRLATGSSN